MGRSCGRGALRSQGRPELKNDTVFKMVSPEIIQIEKIVFMFLGIHADVGCVCV